MLFALLESLLACSHTVFFHSSHAPFRPLTALMPPFLHSNSSIPGETDPVVSLHSPFYLLLLPSHVKPFPRLFLSWLSNLLSYAFNRIIIHRVSPRMLSISGTEAVFSCLLSKNEPTDSITLIKTPFTPYFFLEDSLNSQCFQSFLLLVHRINTLLYHRKYGIKNKGMMSMYEPVRGNGNWMTKLGICCRMVIGQVRWSSWNSGNSVV